MGKKDVIDLYVYTHNEMLHYSAIKMKGILPLAATWKWLGGYAKWNKSDRESQILYDISVISENNKEADSQRINQCLPWGEVWGKRFRGTNHYVCTRGIQPISYNNYKWNTSFNKCESLHCTPITYVILYTNYSLI